MNNLKLLMKIQIQSLISKTTLTRKSKKKLAGLGMLVFMAAILMYMSCVYVFSMVTTFPDGYQFVSLYIIGIMTIFMLLIFGYQSAGGHLFGFKDFDLLMSLPVSKEEVLVSKFLSFLVLEYFYGFFLLAPAIVIVGIVSHYGWLYYLFGVITWIIVPIVPMVIASVLAYSSQFMASKFKYKNLMNNIFYIVLMLAVFVLIFAYQSLMNKDVKELLDIVSNIRLYLPFMAYLFDGMIFHDFGHFLIGLVINLLVLVAFIVIFSKNFMKLNGQIKSGYKVKNFKLSNSKMNSLFNALFLKEVRMYFSNTIYFMNTAIMPILAIIGLGYVCLFMKDEMILIKAMFPEVITLVLCGFIFMMTLMSCTTNSTISLEGANFDNLKSYPIDTMEIFAAKMTLNLMVVIPFGFICSFMAFIFLHLSVVDLGLGLLTSCTSAFFISALGLILNLHFYRLDWENVTIVVKQSLPVMVTTLGGMLVGILIIGGGLVLMDKMNSTLLILMLNGVLFIIDVLFYLYLKTGGRKQFNKIH
ncbi:MAG: hypothetical protein ACI4U3_10130 [Traorella sp.]